MYKNKPKLLQPLLMIVWRVPLQGSSQWMLLEKDLNNTLGKKIREKWNQNLEEKLYSRTKPFHS